MPGRCVEHDVWCIDLHPAYGLFPLQTEVSTCQMEVCHAEVAEYEAQLFFYANYKIGELYERLHTTHWINGPWSFDWVWIIGFWSGVCSWCWRWVHETPCRDVGHSERRDYSSEDKVCHPLYSDDQCNQVRVVMCITGWQNNLFSNLTHLPAVCLVPNH